MLRVRTFSVAFVVPQAIPYWQLFLHRMAEIRRRKLRLSWRKLSSHRSVSSRPRNYTGRCRFLLGFPCARRPFPSLCRPDWAFLFRDTDDWTVGQDKRSRAKRGRDGTGQKRQVHNGRICPIIRAGFFRRHAAPRRAALRVYGSGRRGAKEDQRKPAEQRHRPWRRTVPELKPDEELHWTSSLQFVSFLTGATLGEWRREARSLQEESEANCYLVEGEKAEKARLGE